MKRLFSIVLTVILVLSFGFSSMAAELVSVNDGSNPDIPVSNIVAQFSGHGDQVIQGADLPAGFAFKLTATHNGSRNFAIKEYIDDERGNLLVNRIGNYAGTVLFNEGKTSAVPIYMIEVMADGDWTITLSTVTNASTLSMQGHGDKITGLFSLPSNMVATFKHDGTRNFAIRMYHSGDKYGELLVNKIGAYTGQVVMKGKKKAMTYLEVMADGNWTITIGAPTDPCIVPDIN